MPHAAARFAGRLKPVLSENLLAGSLIRLTALRESDTDVMARSRDDATFWRLQSTTPAAPTTAEAVATVMRETAAKDDTYLFVIRPLDDDRYVGMINLHSIEWNHGAAQLGMGIDDPADRGKGYGREALELVLRFAFHELNLHRVGLGVFDYNTPAIRLYESVGFVAEGADREYLNRDGRRHDALRFGLLRSEWEASHEG